MGPSTTSEETFTSVFRVARPGGEREREREKNKKERECVRESEGVCARALHHSNSGDDIILTKIILRVPYYTTYSTSRNQPTQAP